MEPAPARCCCWLEAHTGTNTVSGFITDSNSSSLTLSGGMKINRPRTWPPLILLGEARAIGGRLGGGLV